MLPVNIYYNLQLCVNPSLKKNFLKSVTKGK
jgi:hypothetical protein